MRFAAAGLRVVVFLGTNEHLFFYLLCRRVSQLVSGNVSFGVIPAEHWNQPDWIDEDHARDGRNRLMAQNIIYGGA